MIPKFKRRFEFFYKLHPATSDRFQQVIDLIKINTIMIEV